MPRFCDESIQTAPLGEVPRRDSVSHRLYDASMSERYVAGAAYTADRAAALAGVPLSTLHYWARSGIWAPSVSRTRTKRWSYADLLALRLIDWLRREKSDLELPRTSLNRIRSALEAVDELGTRLEKRGIRVWVDPHGGLVIDLDGELLVPLSRGAAQVLAHLEGQNLVEVWKGPNGVLGPNLLEPRPTLRIIPGKLSGEPHVADTRIPTKTISSLSRRGLETDKVRELYPQLTPQSIEEAISLEAQLDRNLGSAA